MWLRLLVAPWWVRWLIGAAVTAATLAAIAALLFPRVFTTTGALRGWLAVAGFGMIISASMLYVQAPLQQRLVTPIVGLDREQRAQIWKALRRGEIPADSGALAAATTMAALALRSLRRPQRGASKVVWVVPVLFAVLVILAFVTHDVRHGIFWAGFVLYFTTYHTWLGYRRRRLTQHLESLRAAARDRGIPTELEGSASLPSRRIWALVALFVVVGVTVGAMAYLSDRPDPDCRTANAALADSYRTDITGAWLGVMDRGDVDRYRAWSDQLHSYARQPSNGPVGGHLRRMADLSGQAVSLLEDIGRDKTSSAPADVVARDQNAYLNTITQMLDEQEGLLAICQSTK